MFFVVTLLFAWLLDKLIEGIFIIVGYFSTRFSVPKIKHFDTTQKCISATTMTFLFAVAILCIPKQISLVWSMCVGTVIPLIMYAESLLFDIKLSDKEQLIKLCKEHNYNSLKTEMAVKFFIDKETPKSVWQWLCNIQENPPEWDSVKKAKWRMKKELFKE